jgi:hypothetical protein
LQFYCYISFHLLALFLSFHGSYSYMLCFNLAARLFFFSSRPLHPARVLLAYITLGFSQLTLQSIFSAIHVPVNNNLPTQAAAEKLFRRLLNLMSKRLLNLAISPSPALSQHNSLAF